MARVLMSALKLLDKPLARESFDSLAKVSRVVGALL